jgi:hypothetical protein
VKHADDALLEELVYYTSERQRVFVNRTVRGDDPPWSDDPLLRKYHFCRNYREADAGTQYALDEILCHDDPADVLLNIVVYRLINDPDTFHQLRFQPVADFDPEWVVERLAYYEQIGETVFSSAYRTPPHKFAGSDSKVENIIYGIIRDDLLADLDWYVDEVMHAETMEAAHQALCELRGFGDFLAYEVITDLNYRHLPFHENDFVNVGPGAEQGMEFIWGDAKEDYVWWLVDHTWELFDRYDYDFVPYNGCRFKEPTARTWEHVLCEHRKYHQAMQGTGNLRLYDPYDQQSLGDF